MKQIPSFFSSLFLHFLRDRTESFITQLAFGSAIVINASIS